MGTILEAFKNIPDEVWEKMAADMAAEEQRIQCWVEKVHALGAEKRYETIRKIKAKYDSDEYIDSEYHKGYFPRTPLYNLLVDYARIHGTPTTEGVNEYFPEDAYIVDDKIIVRIIFGQGSVVHVEFIEEKQ